MTKFICGQSFAAFPTSHTVLYCNAWAQDFW
jgi:hypothetical protein